MMNKLTSERIVDEHRASSIKCQNVFLIRVVLVIFSPLLYLSLSHYSIRSSYLSPSFSLAHLPPFSSHPSPFFFIYLSLSFFNEISFFLHSSIHSLHDFIQKIVYLFCNLPLLLIHRIECALYVFYTTVLFTITALAVAFAANIIVEATQILCFVYGVENQSI